MCPTLAAGTLERGSIRQEANVASLAPPATAAGDRVAPNRKFFCEKKDCIHHAFTDILNRTKRRADIMPEQWK